MGTVGSIMVQLGLNITEFQRGLKKAETALKDVGEGFTKVGEGMAKSISLPLMAIGGVAIAGAIEVEKSQSMIQAQLGITGKEAENLQGVVNDIFSDGLGGDMSEVQNSVTTVIRQMKSLEGASDEMVKEVTINSLNLSKAFETDTKDISKSVNNMQVAFGDVDMDEAFDNITKGFQNGLDYSGEFLDSVNEYSVHFAKMGFSADEMFGFFNAGAEAGVFQLDKVGDLVKEMNIRFSDNTAGDFMKDLSDETNKLYEAYQKTGEGGTEVFQSIMEDIGQMDDKQEAYRIGVGLMGTQFEDLDMKAVNALANVRGGLEGAEGSMNDLNGAMNQDLGTVLTGAFREISIALAPLGIEIGKLVQEYLPPFIEKIQQAGEWFTGLSDKGKLLVVALGGLAVVFPFLLIGIGATINSIGAIMGAFSGAITVVTGVTRIFGKLKNVMNLTKILPLLTSPIGLIIVAIVGLIAVGVLIWKNWDTIKAKAIEIWGAISNYFSDTWDSISSGVSTFLSNIGNWFTEKWESISSKTSEIFNAIVDFIVEWGLKLFNLTPIGAFVNLIIDNWEFISESTSLIFQMISDIIVAIWEAVVGYISPIISGIVTFITSCWNSIKSFTTKIFNAVKTFLLGIWQAIVGFIVPIVTSIWKGIKEKWDAISKFTSEIFKAISKFLTGIWGEMKKAVVGKATEIWTSVKEKFTAIKKSITEPIKDAKKTISGYIDDIKGFFTGLKLKIPMPSMPKFSVSKGTATFLGKEITVPKFDVSWNAKGNIFNGASVLGGGQGVGEAGAEVVMPISHKRYMKPYASLVADLLSEMEDGSESGGNVINNFTISQLVVREEADIEKIALSLEKKQRQQARAKGTMSFA